MSESNLHCAHSEGAEGGTKNILQESLEGRGSVDLENSVPDETLHSLKTVNDLHCAHTEGADGGTKNILQETLEGHKDVDLENRVPDEASHSLEAVDDDVPRLGMIFPSEESAFEFYSAYAGNLGFTVRKGSVRRLRDGTLCRRTLVCSKEGHTDVTRRDYCKFPGRKREPKRTGCMASISFMLKEDKTWVASKYCSEHNHPLGIPVKKFKKRRLELLEDDENDNLNEMGMRPADNFNYTSGEMPQVGMSFQSEESAIRFYKAYARRVGFVVRRGKVMRLRNGIISRRYFVCSSEGHQQHNKVIGKKKYPQARTDCKARVVFKIKRDDEWPWVVNEVISEHNHPLGIPAKPHSLKSKRVVRPFKNVASINHASEVVRRAENLRSVNGSHDKSCLSTKRTKRLKKGDAQHLLDYFQRMQLTDPSFFYTIQVDKDDQITNFFWADSSSILNYGYFGDVVCLDTTYRAQVHNLPFVPFVGVNHHKQAVLFGGALLLDETLDSFLWLFETWIKAMRGQQPKTIITDHCATIAKAISLVLPETSHRFCLRQIFESTLRHLSHIHESDSSFSSDFRNTIYLDEAEDDFLSGWYKMLEKYNLIGNTWLKDLYEVRTKWALVYGRGSFCACMFTSQQNDNMTELFNERLKRNLPLLEFVNDYEKALANLYEEELREDFNSMQNEPPLCLDVPMLKRAAKEYTREAFDMFEEQFKHCFCCRVENSGEDGTNYKYKVSQFGKSKEYIVTFNSSNCSITCSCKKFEFVGILCMHAMKVLFIRNIFDLSPEYILRRWTKDAKVGAVRHPKKKIFNGRKLPPMSLRYGELCYKSIGIVGKGALSEKTISVASCALDKVLEELETVLEAETSQKPQTELQNSEADGAQHVDVDDCKEVKDYDDDDDDADDEDGSSRSESMLVGTKSGHDFSDATSSRHLQQRKRKRDGSSNTSTGLRPLQPYVIIQPQNMNAFVQGNMPYVVVRPTQGISVARDGPTDVPSASKAASICNSTSSSIPDLFGFPEGVISPHAMAAKIERIRRRRKMDTRQQR